MPHDSYVDQKLAILYHGYTLRRPCMATYDIIIKHGTVIDPSQGLHALRDVAISGGRIVRIARDLAAWQAAQVIDAQGLLVTPGLVDLHVHIAEGVSHYGIDADLTCLAKGVTTALDAGSSGADTFLSVRRHIIEKSATRLYALLHISSQGMLNPRIGELEDDRWGDVDVCAAMIDANRDVLLGVKTRLSIGQTATAANGNAPLMNARAAANVVGLPLMVHPQRAYCPSADEILAVFGPGDIFTHCFHGASHGILDDQGNVRASVWDARERGIVFDVGHGAGSCCWRVSEAALSQELLPMTISSDLHTQSIAGPVYDLPTTLDKFMLLGMSLDEVIERATVVPGRLLATEQGLGTLAQGVCADVAIFDLQDGAFALTDAAGETRTSTQHLAHKLTIRAGAIVAQDGRLL